MGITALFKRPARKEGSDSEFAATVAQMPPHAEAAVPLPAATDGLSPDSLPPDSLTFDSLPPELPPPSRPTPLRTKSAALALPELPALDSLPPEPDAKPAAAPASPFEPQPAKELPPFLGGPTPKPASEAGEASDEDDDSLPMADQPTLAQVGRYALKRSLGLGGLGQVHEAWDPLLSRTVAIKTLQFESDPRTRNSLDRLFLNEARAVAGLSHPHIVTVYDAGLSPQGVYLAMERLQGKDLRQRLQEGWRPGPAVAAQLVRRAADALAYAHARGVVHCDIKPGNIFIIGNDKPKVLDFGIARVAHGRNVPSALQGAVAGSPHYLAPEQLLSKEVDARTDIYSLGVVFYELLSGRRAFGGDSVEQITTAVLTNHPAPAHLIRSGVPEALSAIAARAMAREPEGRYATASEMAADIRNWFDQPRPAATGSKEERAEARRLKKATQPSGPRRWPWAVAGAGAALLGIGAVALALVMRAAPPPPAATEANAPPDRGAAPTPAAAAGTPREGDIVLSGGVPVAGATAGPGPASSTADPAAAAPSGPSGPVVGAADTPSPPAAAPEPRTAPAATRATPAAARATGTGGPANARDARDTREAAQRRAATPGAGNATGAAVSAGGGGTGTLQLAISPWGQIEVNGQPAGTAPPLTQLSLPVGSHVITVRNADFPPITVTVQVQADKPAAVRHRFGQ